jgi:hypothetical protein
MYTHHVPNSLKVAYRVPNPYHVPKRIANRVTMVTTRSSVHYDPRVLEEVANFAEAFTDLLSQPYPQYFKHLGLVSELLKAESSNFPTLFAVVQELQSGRDGSNSVRINRYSSCN